MKNTALRFGLALGAMSLCLAPVAAQQRFDQLAPEQTLLVVSAPDMSMMMNHIHDGLLGEMWNSPEVQEMVHDLMERMHGAMNKAADDLDVDEDAFAWPTGSVGAAMFMAMNDDLGINVPGMLFAADFGEDMQKIEPLIEKMLEKARGRGAITDERDVLGRTVHTFKTAQEEPEVDPDDPWAQEMAGMENPLASGMKELHFARSGNYLVACSDMNTLRDVFGRLDGDTGHALADREAYRNALAQIGSNDFHMVMLTDGAGDLAAGAGPMAMALPMLMGPVESLGITKVKALSMGLNFDHQGAMVAQSMGLYIPEGKSGILKLLDLDSAKGDLPPFVGPDVAGYSRYNFKFSGMMEVVRNALAAVPEMMQADIEEFMMGVGPMLDQLFSSIGPEIHVIKPVASPQPAAGMDPMMMGPMGQLGANLIAIRCTNPDAIQNLLGGFAPQMGMQPRDFLGQTIFSDQMGMFSIGLGGGFVFVGPGPQVEQALRATGQKNLPSLTNEPVFRQAMGFLPAGNAIAWGFTDTGAQMKNIFEMLKNGGPMGMMPPMGPGMGMPAGLDEMPDLTPLAKYFGPGVWEMQSVSDGFVVHSYSLPPAHRN